MSAIRALLSDLIDYAGMFPPAGLEMAEAVRNYDAYRRGEYGWALGRLVVPATRLDELSVSGGGVPMASRQSKSPHGRATESAFPCSQKPIRSIANCKQARDKKWGHAYACIQSRSDHQRQPGVSPFFVESTNSYDLSNRRNT